MRPHFFAIASRDEIWVHGLLIQQRIEHGEARYRDGIMTARDRLDPATRRACDDLVERNLEVARQLDDCRVRIVASARRVEADDVRFDSEDLSISITKGALSVVTTPENLEEAVGLLRTVGDVGAGSLQDGLKPAATFHLPFVWRNGSASILLHEAAGHAAEHAAPPLQWPRWLTVRDVPRLQFDDAGESPAVADLTGGQSPHSFRRESFRDVPLRRMVDVVVEQRDAPFEEPSHRIDVHLVEGGSYDPLTEVVTLRIAAADLIEDAHARRLPAFDIVRTRASIARSLTGAIGSPIRYPGVVCSREGQELLVGSQAPVMLTIFHD